MISVVVTVFNEKESVATLHAELITVLTELREPFEIIFVNDGSTDGTLDELKKLTPVRIISFARNLGKSQALQAGFAAAHGEYIFTMDGDLQDDPAEIPHFLKTLRDGCDLVVGWKQNRLDGVSKNAVSKIANRITGWATGAYVHDMNCGYKLYKSEVAKNLVLTGDHHRFIPALVASKGYRVCEQKVRHRRRKFGESKYGNFGRFFKSFFDFVTVILLGRYGRRPMHLFGIFGFITAAIGFIILIYLSWLIVVQNEVVGDRPLLLLGVLLVVVGFQSFVSGFLGELFVRQQEGRQSPIVSEEITH
ncbi:MAG: glycosyltransferase family 2 protein [Candidatus Pacebacteria bacterium]|nr:glycosyltransferase family 2 protein [Candidatus Paceibacterota bacterium]